MALYRPLLHFFRALVQPEYSAVTDVYVLMFLADTVDFIIIVFGFWAFGVRRRPRGAFARSPAGLTERSISPETLGRRRHHFLSVGGPGSGGLPGHGSHPVWYDGASLTD